MLFKSAALAALSALAVCCAPRPAQVENLGAECPRWKASWIGASWMNTLWDAQAYESALTALREGVRDTTLATPEFRKAFTLDKRLRKATAYVCGLGFGELWLNGIRVGTDQLSPNETEYTSREGLEETFVPAPGRNFSGYHVQYMSYDVTSFLHKGENVAGLFLGNGFFHTHSYRWTSSFGAPRIICQIDLEFTDGSTGYITTDQSWDVRRSPILINDMYDGEVYDATYCGAWEKAELREAPDGEMVPQLTYPDKVMEILPPKSIEKTADGCWRVDFGDYITGWTALKHFTAPSGTVIDIVHEAECDGNGLWRYVSDGNTAEYAPRFTWYTFRYVTISGWPGELAEDDIEARAVYGSMPVNSKFECSDTLINRIVHIWWRSQTDNMHVGVATDCPHREKGPYTGDGELACPMVVKTFDALSFYRKWLRDMRDCQDRETGYVPNGAPWHPGCGGGVPWGSAICIMPWECYLQYGDSSILEENFKAMCDYTDYLTGWRRPDGTCYQQIEFKGEPLDITNLGEWLSPGEDPKKDLVHTHTLWKCAKNTAAAARALGRKDEEVKYAALADDVAKAFHARFYDAEYGHYGHEGENSASTPLQGRPIVGNGSDFFALDMDVPEERYQSVMSVVKENFKANGDHLNTGISGTPLFFRVLCDLGEYDMVWKAISTTGYPSFGWWIAQGADTFWEQWSGDASRNHPMFGGALVWLYTHLAGLSPDPEEPGYKHMIVRPCPMGDLTYAAYSVDTRYGEAAVRWERTDGVFSLYVTVPEGCRASVWLPGEDSPVEAGPGKNCFKREM